jgi:phosphoribosyl 1,2-cyclic phosphodiesterase
MEGFCSLGSGSKGNSLYIGTKKTKILIDAGLSALTIRKRLSEIGIELEEIQAILISHEHADHIQGLKRLAFHYQIPILANAETAKGIYAAFHECPKFKIFTTGETFKFGDFAIHPFSVPHDTVDPVGFTLLIEGLKLGVCTDLGFATSLVRESLRKCDYLFIEANHEPGMVHASSRPEILKQRILGRSGHLSNEACGLLLKEVYHQNLKQVQLAHLSEECNAKERALAVVKEKLGEIGRELLMRIAPQHELGAAVTFA